MNPKLLRSRNGSTLDDLERRLADADERIKRHRKTISAFEFEMRVPRELLETAEREHDNAICLISIWKSEHGEKLNAK